MSITPRSQRISPTLTVWDRGDVISAERLNEPIQALQNLYAVIPPSSDTDLPVGTLEAEETDEEIEQNPEVWAFVSKETRTERIEDATDDTIYIDVTVTTSVTVKRPDGIDVQIQLEAVT